MNQLAKSIVDQATDIVLRSTTKMILCSKYSTTIICKLSYQEPESLDQKPETEPRRGLKSDH